MGCAPSNLGKGSEGEGEEGRSSAGTQNLTQGAKSKNTLGNDAYERGDYEDSVKFYTAALQEPEKSRSFPLYLVNRATAYHRLQEFNLSVADLKKSIELEPNRRAYKQLITTYMAMLNYSGAVEACEGVLKLDPDDDATENQRINLQIYLDKKAGDITRCFGLCCEEAPNDGALIAAPATPPILKRGFSEMAPRGSGMWN